MHDLMVERFYTPHMEGGMMMTKQGPIKTFPLRGIKESPPYFARWTFAYAGRHRGVFQSLKSVIDFLLVNFVNPV